jgi:ATP/ADP translocase
MENEKKSGKEQLVIDILDSWIGKLISSIVYHLLWRVFQKQAKGR